MEVSVIFPPKARDVRLDLLRGIANWAIFLNHMPNNVVNWITTRNYGFSDGADLFVFILGYTAAFVFGRMMRDYGFVIGATRLWKRVWQLYLAHVVLFVVYVAAVGYVALRFQLDNIIHEFNVAWLIEHPFVTLIYALLLGFKPVNLDVLPLYIVLMALFPFVLWIMLRRPNLTILARFCSTWRLATSAGISLPIRRGLGSSIHSAGNSCSAREPGSPWAEARNCGRSSRRDHSSGSVSATCCSHWS